MSPTIDYTDGCHYDEVLPIRSDEPLNPNRNNTQFKTLTCLIHVLMYLSGLLFIYDLLDHSCNKYCNLIDQKQILYQC